MIDPMRKEFRDGRSHYSFDVKGQFFNQGKTISFDIVAVELQYCVDLSEHYDRQVWEVLVEPGAGYIEPKPGSIFFIYGTNWLAKCRVEEVERLELGWCRMIVSELGSGTHTFRRNVRRIRFK